MSGNNKFFKILKEEMLNCFDAEVEKLAWRLQGILENKTWASLHPGSNAVSEKLQELVQSKVEKSAASYLVTISSGASGLITSPAVKSSYTSLPKQHESNRIKGFAERHSTRVKKGLAGKSGLSSKNNLIKTSAGKLANKGKQGIKLFEIALKQAMPVIEKEITNLSIT